MLKKGQFRFLIGGAISLDFLKMSVKFKQSSFDEGPLIVNCTDKCKFLRSNIMRMILLLLYL